MIRRFNYTGRKRLKHHHTKVFVRRSASDRAEFDTQLSLAGYELPAEAMVFIEAYRQTSFMRFPCGTVGQLALPADRTLSEFDSPEGVSFRVRITSSGNPEGLLLAIADQIRPKEADDTDQDRISLLPVKQADDLDDRVYWVDLTDDPILLINSSLGDWRAVARDPVFISLVYPAAMRQVLIHILRVERYFDDDDLSDWRSQWLHFAKRLPSVGDIPAEAPPGRVDDWISEAVSSFCRQYHIAQKFGKYWTGEVGS